MKSIKWDGQPIAQKGMYEGVPMGAYHGNLCVAPSVSSTGLRKLFSRSPAVFYDTWYGNPNRDEDQDDKEAFIIGRATHHLLLGQPYFAKEFVIQPDEYTDAKTGEEKKWNANANVCKDWLAEQSRKGLTVLTGKMVESIKGMALSLGTHPLIRQGILNGLVERSVVWQDKATGIWLKARPDAIPTSSGDFADLKTTTSVEYRDLVLAMDKFHYHVQAALIRMACREVLGIPFSSFTLVFVEKKRPFCVRDVRVKDSDLDRGEQQIRMALDIMAGCLKSKSWPGPGAGREGSEFVELSEHARKRIDDRLERLTQEMNS